MNTSCIWVAEEALSEPKEMQPMHEQAIEQTASYVRAQLADAEAGHDWWHSYRVWEMTRLLLRTEKHADPLVCQLAALLHDIADSKFYGGDESIGPEKAGAYLRSIGVGSATVQHVCAIISNISYSTSLAEKTDERFRSAELDIVQDADRLDALGAIGIARAFHYGGFRNRLLYHPDIPPMKELDKETYQKGDGPTINHFYEKLLLLRDQMNTATGRQLARARHAYMEGFLRQFLSEWPGASPIEV